LPPDMRKRPLITGGCCHLPLYSYGYDEMSTEPKLAENIKIPVFQGLN